MSGPSARPPIARLSAGAPLRHAVFRNIWLASLLSNLGLLVQGVATAWLMTQLTTSIGMVALVQTASLLPVMLVSLAAGALADMYDRRLVKLAALSISFIGAVALTVMAWRGLTTPSLLLAFCFVIGSGMALFGPAWQASVPEQVPDPVVPAAIALTSISYNIARSFGPAVGGFIVATAGATAAFLCNALFYLPLIAVLLFWKRVREPARLPPEQLSRAVAAGLRYVANSPAIRIVLVRTLVSGLLGASIPALMPLVARTLLGGTAQTYGLLLGAFGAGAVIGALNLSRLRDRFSPEGALRICALLLGVATIVVGFSRSTTLTVLTLLLAGGVWTMVVAQFNIAIQLAAPRWVAGRALAMFQAAIAGGVAMGSYAWGVLAGAQGVGNALAISGLTLAASPILGLWLRLPEIEAEVSKPADELADPDITLAVSARSGPIVVMIEYRIPLDKARAFYNAVVRGQIARQRNGAYGWSISRDMADPALWIERFHVPTWLDYLRHRNRPTQVERDLMQSAWAFHSGPDPVVVRRMLERPLGSVRWADDTPDAATDVIIVAP